MIKELQTQAAKRKEARKIEQASDWDSDAYVDDIPMPEFSDKEDEVIPKAQA